MAFFTRMDNNIRIFSGWATVAIFDKDGELIPIDTILEKMHYFMLMDGLIMLNHTSWRVGKLTHYEKRYNEQTGKDGIYVEGIIYDFNHEYPIFDETWNSMQTGELDELSIAGEFDINENGVAMWSAPMEISVTGLAVNSQAINPAARIEAVSRSKSKNIMAGGKVEDEKKEFPPNPEEKSDALKLKTDAEAKPEETKPDSEIKSESAGEEVKPSETEVKKSDEEAGQEGAKPSLDRVIEEVRSHGDRLFRIEQMLDKLVEMEEEEYTTDAAITKAEEQKKEEKEEPKEEKKAEEKSEPKEEKKLEEKEAKMSKELSDVTAQFSKEIENLKGEVKELTAKLSKIENTGMRRTIPSGSQPEENDAVRILREIGIEVH